MMTCSRACRWLPTVVALALQQRPEDILGIYRLDALNAVLDDGGLPPIGATR